MNDFDILKHAYDEKCLKCAALEALVPFLVHAYLECAESAHADCPCGLDELTDAAHLPRCDSYPL